MICPILEIVAVNDGSTDKSASILNDFAARYPQRIKAIHKKNGGLSDARNAGIENSSGEYLGFVDGDDWVRKDMYELLHDEAVSSQSDIVVCAHQRLYSDKDKSIRPRNSKGPVRGTYQDFGQSVVENPRLLYASRSYAWNKLYRKKLFLDGAHRFPFGRWFEDSSTIYNVMLDANKISCVFEGLYFYRIRPEGSITSSISPRIFDIFFSCDAFLNYYYENTAIDNALKHALGKVVQSHIIRRFSLFEGKTDFRGKLLGLRYVNKAFAYLNLHFPGWTKNSSIMKRKRTKHLALMYVVYPYTLKALRLNVNEKRSTARRALADDLVNVSLQQYGYEIFGEIDAALKKLSRIHFADFDTLLGFVKEGQFLPKTSEIDFGIFTDEARKSDIVDVMSEAGYVFQGSYSHDGKLYEQAYSKVCGGSNLVVRFHYYESQIESSGTYLFYVDPYIEYHKKDHRSIARMTYSRIVQTKDIFVKGMTVPIPVNADDLLEEKYGRDWKAPNETKVFWESPAATRLQEVALLENG